LVTAVLGKIDPGSIKTKIDYFERKLSEFQIQMRELEKVNQDSQEEHQSLQAWAMGIKPYRKYSATREFYAGLRVDGADDGETDP
jgi:hypothetical protein